MSRFPAAAVLLLCAPAFAQETAAPLETIPVEELAKPPDEPKPQEAEPRAELETVVVTATKRAANPRDLPSSVTALRGEDLEQHGYQQQDEFLKLVPGLTFYSDSITPNRITIRGISSDIATSNTTGVFIGDVPFEDPTLPRVTLDPNPFDLERIEVLKGPQGTLFGGSALNGAVRYVPQEPKIAQWETKGYGQLESVTQGGLGWSYGGAVNVPAGETFAMRIVGFNRHAAGWVDDAQRGEDVNQLRQHGGRAMALWQPGERWKISAMAVLQDTLSLEQGITDNREGRLSRSNMPQPSPVSTKYNLQTLGIQYSFDAFDVLSQTSRTHKDFVGTVDASRIGNVTPEPPPSVTITADNHSQSIGQELRFTSSEAFSSRWKWLGGLFYRRVHMHEVTDILASNQALPIPSEVLQLLGGLIPGFWGVITEEGRVNVARGLADPVNVTELAAFGETSVMLFDDLEVTLGLRAFRTSSQSRVEFSGAAASDPRNSPTSGLYRVNAGDFSEKGINPKVALKYRFNRNASAYASAAKGFRFGGAQVLVGTVSSDAPAFYKSDTIWNYEVGLRTQWLRNTLIADVTGFQIDWTDPQLQQADATGVGAYLDNVGGARGRGVEGALRYLTPLPGLALSFTGSYVNTVTTKAFTTSSGDEAQPGTTWPLASKWQSVSTLTYQHALFGNWSGGGTVTYSTISSAPNTLSYLDTVFGFKTLDVMLNLGSLQLPGRPELSVSLNNATDVRGIVSGVNNPQFPLDHVYIRPRTLVARVGFTF